LSDELESRRQTLVDGGVPTPIYFGTEPVIQIYVQDNPNDPFVEVAPEEIHHHDVIHFALEELREDLGNSQREEVLHRLRHHLQEIKDRRSQQN